MVVPVTVTVANFPCGGFISSILINNAKLLHGDRASNINQDAPLAVRHVDLSGVVAGGNDGLEIAASSADEATELGGGGHAG